MSDLPRLLHRSRRADFAGLVLCGLGQAAVAGGVAVLMRFTFDSLFGAEPRVDPASLGIVAAGLTAAGVALLGLRVLERWLAERLGQHYAASLRARLFRHALATPIRDLKAKRRGALMLRFVGDLAAIRGWVSAGVARMIVAAVVLPSTFAILALINAPMTFAGAALLITASSALLALQAPLGRRHHEERRRRSRLAAELGEKMGEAAVVRVSGRGDDELRRLRRLSRGLANASVQRAWVSALVRTMPDAAAAVALGVVVVIGVHEVARGAASPGAVVAVITALGLLAAPFRELAGVLDRRRAYVVARDKIRNFLATATLPSAPAEDPPTLPGPVALRFEDVSISDTLEDVTLEAPPGSVVAVVGQNGAGKSSLLFLAGGLLAPGAGRVLVDGQPVTEIAPAELAPAIGIASPDLPLLRGTIRDAVRYRDPDVDQSELERVAGLVGLEPILERLPNGWDERLAEGGRNLSAGARQRVTLARALMGRPGLLLLDEVDAELDGDGRAMLDRLLDRREETTLIVTHDPARLQKADIIWHLDEGRVVEVGAPAELLASGGATARLFGHGRAGKVASRARPSLQSVA